MYAGVIFFFLCLPPALGSYYGLIPALIISLLFIARTSLEDKTLRRELPGYRDYAESPLQDCLPRIWEKGEIEATLFDPAYNRKKDDGDRG
jgi:hypothetical protein